MKKARLILDAAMVLLMPLLMAYSLIGELFHEVAGTLILLLFLLHHWLNRAWWKTLFRGRVTPQRLFRNVLNILLLIFMIAQPLSGIFMSKYLFTFLPVVSFSSLSRTVHLTLAYWGFVLMSLHAGTHLEMMLPKGKSRKATLACLAAVALYGIYAFFRRQIGSYMFMKSAFVFFDYSEPILFFLADYFTVMILLALLGYGIITLLSGKKQKQKT